MSRRERDIPYKTGRVRNRNWNYLGGTLVSSDDRYRDLRSIIGKQVTVSDGHPWRTRKEGSLEDIGGNFFTTRQYAKVIPSHFDVIVGGDTGGGWTYSTQLVGDVIPSSNFGVAPVGNWCGFPPAINSSTAQLNQLGATAVNLASPTNSVADLSTALGELIREGIPTLPLHVWDSIRATGRNIGSGYLSVEFGIKPIVRDVEKFLNAVREADVLLSQFERDAGRVVRRRWSFPPQVTSFIDELIETGEPEIGFSSSGVFRTDGVGRTLHRRREISRRQWFSGAFTYYLPSGYDSRKEMARYRLLAEKVLGLQLTPELIWNLAPWSWAADWFSNAGDVLSNVSNWALNRQVMRYGYLMEHTIIKDTYSRPVSRFINGNPCGVVELVTETKVRQRANPFGFGVSWSGLSPYQLSIAAALGLSRQ